MGGALIGGLCHDYVVTVCDQDSKKTALLRRKYGIKSDTLTQAVEGRDVIILAVKPQDFEPILISISPLVTSRQLVISVAAGLTTNYIERYFEEGRRVIRVMPNLPALIGQGISGIAAGKSARKTDLALACRLFSTVGRTLVVEEKWIDAVTAVSGSGPAYVFYFAEILQSAAVSLGLTREMARQLVLQTLKGSVAMLDQRQANAADLRQKVTSKGGTTAAALSVLTEQKTEKIFHDALRAARQRAKELAK